MASSAKLRAEETPPFFLWMMTNLGSLEPYSSRILPELSIDPSSTAKMVKFLYV